MSERWEAARRRSLENPQAFWAEAASALDWFDPPRATFDARSGVAGRWFTHGTLNTCYNALDRHVERGRGAQAALIYDSPVTGSSRSLTYAELLRETALTAGMLERHGVRAGDRVVIYMPMIPEAVIAMLACARIGAVHSVVFGGFAAPELAKRIDDAQPKLVLAASCGVEPNRIVEYKPMLDAALEQARHVVPRCIVLQRPQSRATLQPGRDIDWRDARDEARPAECAVLRASDPLYILYTSGTTGLPKGVVRDNGGHAVALAWSMANVYGARAGEAFWAASDIGWVVGHSYIVYGPLLHGCTTVLYEGKPVGTPDAGAFWRVVRDHNVRTLFTAPTAIRAIKREDPQGGFIEREGVGPLRALFLAGERADPATVRWAEERLRVPVIDHWWQTELGWPALATCLGLDDVRTRHGSAGKPVCGYEFAVLDAAHQPLPAGEVGDICIRLPLPPGCLTTLWNNDQGFRRSYLDAHPGYYTTGDAGFIDEDGFTHVMSRTDDIINVAGHRLSSGAIEQVIAAHPDVAECAVVGVHDAVKGVAPIALIVLKSGAEEAAQNVVREAVAGVRDAIGPIAAFRSAVIVPQLPKTRSGKILRKFIRELADGEASETPATIENAAAIEGVVHALQSIGYGPREAEHET